MTTLIDDLVPDELWALLALLSPIASSGRCWSALRASPCCSASSSKAPRRSCSRLSRRWLGKRRSACGSSSRDSNHLGSSVSRSIAARFRHPARFQQPSRAVTDLEGGPRPPSRTGLDPGRLCNANRPGPNKTTPGRSGRGDDVRHLPVPARRRHPRPHAWPACATSSSAHSAGPGRSTPPPRSATTPATRRPVGTLGRNGDYARTPEPCPQGRAHHAPMSTSSCRIARVLGLS